MQLLQVLKQSCLCACIVLQKRGHVAQVVATALFCRVDSWRCVALVTCLVTSPSLTRRQMASARSSAKSGTPLTHHKGQKRCWHPSAEQNGMCLHTTASVLVPSSAYDALFFLMLDQSQPLAYSTSEITPHCVQSAFQLRRCCRCLAHRFDNTYDGIVCCLLVRVQRCMQYAGMRLQ